MAEIELAQLLKAGVHFGHKSNHWNPKMFPYIYKERNGIHIIDLVQTAQLLLYTGDVLEKYAEKGKTFLFVGTKKLAAGVTAKQALLCNSFYINHRWLGGTLTNWATIKHKIAYLNELESKESQFNLYSKKEQSFFNKQLDKLRRNLQGVKSMESLPDVIIVIDQNHELTAIREAKKLKIPIVSIVDTNCNPDLIDFPIPGNDDSTSSIQLILNYLGQRIINGQNNQKILKTKN
uniref:Ribosomal protein S2 n=1 Tax=Olisthodiscus luteus TaxID=83000 RepID=A0A7U0KST3_OLILU|nr:ribosomal protein S2 [Olisthodiscus luteus]QQW50521.1 ribosomal protein S2 [Olisthodiscus luteus]